MQNPSPSAGDASPISPLLANVLKVGVVVVLVVLLYLAVGRFSANPTASVRVDLTIASTGSNWTVTFTGVPGGKLPSGMFVLLRDASGTITVPRTSLENLTAGNWAATFVLYEKTNPAAPDVQANDRLLIDRSAHPSGTRIEISDARSILAMDTLK